MSLGQTWRANLKKSQKADLEIADLDFSEYPEFLAIYGRMAERKQADLLGPVSSVPELLNILPADMQPRCVVARHEGEAVAGVVYAQTGDMAYYLYGATNDKALPLRAGYALQWEVLDRLRGKDCWYDLGGAPEQGLRQFKSGLVGKAGSIHTLSEFHYTAGACAAVSLRIVSALRSAKRLLRAIRRRRA